MTLLDATPCDPASPNLEHLFAHGHLSLDLPDHVAAELTPGQHETWNGVLDSIRARHLDTHGCTADEAPEPEPGTERAVEPAAAPEPGADSAPEPDPESEPDASFETDPVPEVPEDEVPAPDEDGETAPETPDEDGEPEPDGPDEEPEPTSTATPASRGSSGSLAGVSPARPGELQDKVATFLADHVGTEYTVTEVAKELRHSGGAVGNAMKTLASDGRITETSSSPRRYTARTPDPYRPAPATRAPLPPRAPAPKPTPAPTPTPAATSTATPPPDGAPPADPTAPIRRANGQMYYPRTLAEHTDVQVLRMLRASDIYALLEGPPGTGKTSLVEATFPDLVLIAGDGDTASADLVGSYVIAEDGSYEWKDGPAVIAAQEGRPLFIDDATLIPPKVLAVIYPLMDGRREIVLKEHGGRKVKAAPGFYVIAGHNPHVHGAVLTDALASRFTAPIHVSTDYELAEHLGVHRKAVQIARNLSTQQRNGASGWAPQMRELLAFKAIATALGEDAAFGNMIGQAPPDDRDLVTAVVTKIIGRPVTPLTLGKQAK